eukprot:6739956-Ditylum_brightwellii.AAC.1
MATGETGKMTINNCDRWIIFRDTMSKSKNNDRIFHNIYLTYIIQFYDNERKQEGKDTIPFDII